jgi:hypothetical protein
MQLGPSANLAHALNGDIEGSNLSFERIGLGARNPGLSPRGGDLDIGGKVLTFVSHRSRLGRFVESPSSVGPQIELVLIGQRGEEAEP